MGNRGGSLARSKSDRPRPRSDNAQPRRVVSASSRRTWPAEDAAAAYGRGSLIMSASAPSGSCSSEGGRESPSARLEASPYSVRQLQRNGHAAAEGAGDGRQGQGQPGLDLALELLPQGDLEEAARAALVGESGGQGGVLGRRAAPQHGALEAYLPSRLATELQRLARHHGAGAAGAALSRAPEPQSGDENCAALFVDVSGFTALEAAIFGQCGADEARAAGELAATLNAFLSALLEEAELHRACCRCDVSVESFAGDAMLIVFSAPADAAGSGGATHPALAAGRCAAGLVRQAAACGGQGPSLSPLSIHIGVGAGSVTRCYPGTDTRRHSVCGGPAVQEACGAEPHAQRGQVACGRAALDEILAQWPSARATALPSGFSLLEVDSLGHCEPDRHVARAAEAARPSLGLAVAASPFVPLVVRESLREGLPAWHDEIREASVMFLSVGGESLARATEILEGVCERRGGVLNKIIVDDKGCVAVAAFGLPFFAHLDDAGRAVAAGEEALALLAAAGLPPPPASPPAGAAPPALASIPRPAPPAPDAPAPQYTVLGRTVNLAARLMQHAENRVLVDEATCRRARQRAAFSHPPLALRLKGFEGLTEAHALLSVKSWHGAARRASRSGTVGRPAGVAPLVGRDSAVKQATKALLSGAAGAAGARRALLVEGPAGVGKSSLLAAVDDAVGRRGLPSLTLSGDPARGEPYSAWREALRPVLRAWSRGAAPAAADSSGIASAAESAVPSRVHSSENLGAPSAMAAPAGPTSRELVLRRLAALLPAGALDARAVACLPLLNALHPRLAIPESEETRTMDSEVRRRETERLALLVLRAHATECSALAGAPPPAVGALFLRASTHWDAGAAMFGAPPGAAENSSRRRSHGPAGASGRLEAARPRPTAVAAAAVGGGLEARRVAQALAMEPAWALSSISMEGGEAPSPPPPPSENWRSNPGRAQPAGASILLIVDHVEWIDNLSLSLALAAAQPGGPAVLLAAYRTGDSSLGRQAEARRESVAAAAERLVLAPLSESDTLALARSALGARSLGPAVSRPSPRDPAPRPSAGCDASRCDAGRQAMRLLLERSGGLPLLVREVAGALQLSGLLLPSRPPPASSLPAPAPGEGGEAADADGGGEDDDSSVLELVSLEGAAAAIPADFAALVVSRLSALPFRAQLLLKVAAVCGLQFPITLLCAVHPLSSAELVADPVMLARALSGRDVADLGLERVRRAEVERGGGEEAGSGSEGGGSESESESLLAADAPEPLFRWRHERIRSAVLGLLLPAQRRALHARAALHLAQKSRALHAARSDDAVAYHWEQVGHRRLAALSLVRLAFEARRVFDNATAVDALERAAGLLGGVRRDAAGAGRLSAAAGGALEAEEAVARSELGAALSDVGSFPEAVAQLTVPPAPPPPPPGPAQPARVPLATLGAVARQLFRRAKEAAAGPRRPSPPTIRAALDALLATPPPGASTAEEALATPPALRAVLAGHILADVRRGPALGAAAAGAPDRAGALPPPPQALAKINDFPRAAVVGLRSANAAEARGAVCAPVLARSYAIAAIPFTLAPGLKLLKLWRTYERKAVEHAGAVGSAERAGVLTLLALNALSRGEGGTLALYIEHAFAHAGAAGNPARAEELRIFIGVVAMYRGDIHALEEAAAVLAGAVGGPARLFGVVFACLAAATRRALGWPALAGGPPLAECARALERALASIPGLGDIEGELAAGALALAAALRALAPAGGPGAPLEPRRRRRPRRRRVCARDPRHRGAGAGPRHLLRRLRPPLRRPRHRRPRPRGGPRAPASAPARRLASELLRAARLACRLAPVNRPLLHAARGLLHPSREAEEWAEAASGRVARGLEPVKASSPAALARALSLLAS
eukprot:tig00000350_g24341.t1